MRKFILLLVSGAIISLYGCGDKNESTGEKKEEQKKESQEDVTQNEKETEKKETPPTDPVESDATKTNELGMTPGLPKDFPADVPQPKNAKTLGSLNSSEGTVVTFESTDKVQDIVNFYKDEMKKNGFAVTDGGETLVSDKGGLINWVKEKREVGLMLGFDKDKNITSLVITYK